MKLLEKAKSKLERFAVSVNKTDLSNAVFIGGVGVFSAVNQIPLNPTAEGIASGILYSLIALSGVGYAVYGAVKKG